MSSANPYLSSTTNYHRPNSRSSSYNVQQQQLNDLNSTRSSTSTCSTSHCLSNQCIECTTILSTRNFNSFIDQTSNSSHFVINSTTDNQNIDEQQTTRILSMNIPVENRNNASTLNIEIEEEEDDDDDDDEQQQMQTFNEQLEVFVGFYRPGEYQMEDGDDDDDDDGDDQSDLSQKSDPQKKEEQSTRELISDNDEGNEDQDFIEEDFGPNQDDDNEQQQQIQFEQDNHDDELNRNIIDNNLEEINENNEQIVFVQIDEDEDQGFGAQFNDDCQSSDDENNHLSTLSLNNNDNNNNMNELFDLKKIDFLQRSQSDIQLHKCSLKKFRSLPCLRTNQYEKIEHFIIDDQQPITTMSNLVLMKKKQNDDLDLRKSSEEMIVISNPETSTPMIVDEAVRDVERPVMLWDDEHARSIDNHSSIQQILQYFQLNIEINQDDQSRIPSIRNELLLDYLQYRSEIDISANDLHDNLLQYPDFSSSIYCRFFPFWPPRDVDLLQWLSHWIKQGALPVAIMNMDHSPIQRFLSSSWQHRIIYGVDPRGIYLMNPIQIQSPQKLYEQLTVDSITYITRQDIIKRYNQSPMCLTPLAKSHNQSKYFSDIRWRTMNVLGQVVNVLREDRQLKENELRNIPYRPTVTHVRIPSTCSSGIFIFSKDYNQLFNAIDLPLRQ